MDLTVREAEVARLRDDEGLSWRQIADQLGTSKSAVNSSYRSAMRKRENPEAYKAELKAHGNSVEATRPEAAAAILDHATDPFTTIHQAAKACGFPESTARRLIRRLETRYRPMGDAIREVKRENLLKLLEDRALRCVEHIDDVTLASATIKDLAISAGILIDKSQLLKGEPTQIMSMEDRRTLNELVKALNDEAKRRGLLIDVTPVAE